MKELKDIQNEMSASLTALEKLRQKKLLSQKIRSIAFLFPLFVAYKTMPADFTSLFGWGFCLFLCALPFAIAYGFAIHFPKIDYETYYDEHILKDFVAILYPKISYTQDKKVSFKKFKAAGIFEDYFNMYFGKHLFKGQTDGGNSFEFSELAVSYQPQDRVGSGNGGSGGGMSKNIFNGLFFVLETNETCNSEVYVMPRSTGKLKKDLKNLVKRQVENLFGDSDLDYFKQHPEFNTAFEIYSETPEEAYRLLSPSMIQTLVELKEKWNKAIYVSYVNNKIYIGISAPKNFLKPNMKKDLLKDKHINVLYNELSSCFNLLEELSAIGKIPIDFDPTKDWTTSGYEILEEPNKPKNRFLKN